MTWPGQLVDVVLRGTQERQRVVFENRDPKHGRVANSPHDALIEAVYRTEVEKLAAAQRKFAETMPPIEALRAWMLLFVDYIAAKHIIAPALNTIVGGAAKLYEGSRAQIQGAIDALVKRAIKSGDIRDDLDPFDLLRALIGVSNVASTPDWQQSARRLVDILISGSRTLK